LIPACLRLLYETVEAGYLAYQVVDEIAVVDLQVWLAAFFAQECGFHRYLVWNPLAGALEREVLRLVIKLAVQVIEPFLQVGCDELGDLVFTPVPEIGIPASTLVLGPLVFDKTALMELVEYRAYDSGFHAQFGCHVFVVFRFVETVKDIEMIFAQTLYQNVFYERGFPFRRHALYYGTRT
jgi:hypothetical protein